MNIIIDLKLLYDSEDSNAKVLIGLSTMESNCFSRMYTLFFHILNSLCFILKLFCLVISDGIHVLIRKANVIEQNYLIE